MIKLIPNSFTARLSVVIILSFTAISTVLWFSFGRDRWLHAAEIFAISTADRSMAIATFLDRHGEPSEYPSLIAALNHPGFRALLPHDQPPHYPTAIQENRSRFTFASNMAALIQRETKNRLQQLSNRPHQVIISKAERSAIPKSNQPYSADKLIINTQLKNGLWLTIITRPPFPHSPRSPHLGWLFVGFATLAITLFISHRLSRPIRHLATAADRFGVDINAPDIKVSGPREVRTAATAFNRMQHRLRRFIVDRTQMLAAISHDLRTILTRLQLRAEFISDDSRREKMQSDLNEMNRMLEATLSFAREDAKSETAEITNITALIKTICHDLEEAGKPVKLIDYEEVKCRIQPTEVKRALSNLFENAVRYGGIAEIEIEQSTTQISIHISDHGPGIKPAQQEAVFSPFFRLESSRNRQTGGTGLGLTIARTIIRRQGGDIFLENRQQGGLAVQVTLPCEANIKQVNS